MDWVLQVLAVAGITMVVLALLLMSAAGTLRADARPSSEPLAVRVGSGSPPEVLARLRRPLFEAGVEVGADMPRGASTAITLGWRTSRWRLEVGPEGAVLQGPDGVDGAELIALIESAAGATL